MALSRFVYDASADNFAQLVLGNSERGLVLVHFWTPKAAPCMLLMPRLVRLATEYGGRFLVVMLNVDELGRIARDWSVTSVPTVKFYRHGRVVHTIYGAESDASFRRAIDPLLARPAEGAQARAAELSARGAAEEAYRILASAAMDEPDDPRLPLDLAKLMLANGEPQRAGDLLRSLPPPLRLREDVSQLLAHAELLGAAQAAPAPAALEQALEHDPRHSLARFQRAARRLVADDYAGAMDDLLALLGADPHFNDGAAVRALSAILALPQLPPALAADYRGRLARLASG